MSSRTLIQRLRTRAGSRRSARAGGTEDRRRRSWRPSCCTTRPVRRDRAAIWTGGPIGGVPSGSDEGDPAEPRREVEVSGKRRVKELLVELDILPGTVLVIRRDELLTSDTVVGDDDVLELRPVMSGGGA